MQVSEHRFSPYCDGGILGRLAPIMQCSEADFREYCDGRKDLLWPELDRLITLILREQGKIVAKNRVFLAKQAERRAKLFPK